MDFENSEAILSKYPSCAAALPRIEWYEGRYLSGSPRGPAEASATTDGGTQTVVASAIEKRMEEAFFYIIY